MVSSATLKMASLINRVPLASPTGNLNGHVSYGVRAKRSKSVTKLSAVSPSDSFPRSCSNGASSVGDVHGRRSSLESLFCYDKAIPEERIEPPVGTSMPEKLIGENLRCDDCHAKGAVLCLTCSGSGLYVDSVLESQGIIVKVRCLACGGSGNNLCMECGGQGHLGLK